MKAVILAGGFGTRISEESHLKPKPMIEIGEKPVLWHIMKIYSAYGINDFVICCGYKGYVVKEYFANYFLHMSDVTLDLKSNNMEVHQQYSEPWKVTLVNTGLKTMTGGRLKQVQQYVGNETFCFTYGDGVSDVNITELVHFHDKQGCLATMTAVQPPGRFGALDLSEHKIIDFEEKPHGDGGWINGGFFVLSPKVIERIEDDETIWDQQPLKSLATDGELAAFKHEGFWQPMDTLRDKNMLNDLWDSDKAAWKKW